MRLTIFSRIGPAGYMKNFRVVVADSIRGRILIEGGLYSRKYGICSKNNATSK